MYRLGQHVQKALAEKRPIVALESTIISHGMPYPSNYQTALKCEQIISELGVTPATIGVINGECVIGLNHDEIKLLATNSDVLKISRRDLAYAVAFNKNGATTVSATMYLAHQAGIKIFATGGIGGVHLDASSTFDISADLIELKQTDVCVVCAGAKAILDLSKTMEVLETLGVVVIGYQTNSLPAFYTKESALSVNYRLDTPQDIAKLLKTKHQLGLENGVLVTNPINEENSIDQKIIKDVLDQALLEAKTLDITGKDVTPFLLKKIVALTNGQSLATNIELIYQNCALAASIIKEYYRL